MVGTLQRHSPSDDPLRRITFVENKTTEKKLFDFITRNTKLSFIRGVALGVTEEFLQEDPVTRDTNDAFIQAQTKARQLNVVNDAAEHFVAVYQSFNGILTNQEEQKQFLLQIVEKHRLDFPDSDKSTVVGSFLKH